MKSLNHFKELVKVPHCSFDTARMREFLSEFAKIKGFKVSIDEGGNIHCVKGEPKICLQAHFDMVCMGEAPKIELLEEDGFLKAKNSSLGADNGIGLALIMSAMGEFSDLECLFTDNEEVGLLGANALTHKLLAPRLLNLDHEDEKELIIGCAGGVDIKANLKLEFKESQAKLYELEAVGFKGGHSGIDIIKNHANAIKEMARFIAQNEGQIVEFEGGERINSIPKFARALVFFDKEPKGSEFIKVRTKGRQRVKVCAQSTLLLNAINAFAQGVRAYSNELNIVQTSINLSTLKMNEKEAVIELFARSNVLNELENLEFETKIFFESFEFAVSSSNFYAPWQGEKSAFSDAVFEILKDEFKDARILAVHAGLECGVIEKKQPLECASLGVNIFSPHSTDERCEIASVERIERVLFRVLEKYCTRLGA